MELIEVEREIAPNKSGIMNKLIIKRFHTFAKRHERKDTLHVRRHTTCNRKRTKDNAYAKPGPISQPRTDRMAAVTNDNIARRKLDPKSG